MTESPRRHNRAAPLQPSPDGCSSTGTWFAARWSSSGGRIVDVRIGGAGARPLCRRRALDAEIVSPGLVDLQVNGGFGLEVGGDAAALRALAARLPSTGVTTFLPAVVSAGAAEYRAAAAALGVGARRAGRAHARACTSRGRCCRRRGAGAHRAGRDRRRGRDAGRRAGRPARGGRGPAGDARARAPGRARAASRALRAGRRRRQPGPHRRDVRADRRRRSTRARRWRPTSTTRCRRSTTARRARSAPRWPTIALTVMLIADGVHVHPAALNVALRSKGPERVALVTDAIAAAGAPPGRYALAGVAGRSPTGRARGSPTARWPARR